MKKNITTAVIGVVCVCLVIGFYYYWTHRSSTEQETTVSEVQQVLLKDLSGNSYPKTPREVIKFLVKIQTCLYNEDCTEEELHQLADQMRLLMDDELAQNNPADQLYLRIDQEVASYKENKCTINNATVCDTNDVTYATVDGKECAYVSVSYFTKDKDGFSRVNQNYALRQDDDGNWKILAFELKEGDTESDEQ